MKWHISFCAVCYETIVAADTPSYRQRSLRMEKQLGSYTNEHTIFAVVTGCTVLVGMVVSKANEDEVRRKELGFWEINTNT